MQCNINGFISFSPSMFRKKYYTGENQKLATETAHCPGTGWEKIITWNTQIVSAILVQHAWPDIRVFGRSLKDWTTVYSWWTQNLWKITSIATLSYPFWMESSQIFQSFCWIWQMILFQCQKIFFLQNLMGKIAKKSVSISFKQF